MAGKKTNAKNNPPVSQPDWDAVFQIIHEPAMIVSPDFNILHANLATQKAFGLSEQQLQGRHCYEIFHGTKTAPPGCPLAKLMATGRAQTSELEVEALHGKYHVSCTPIFDENGKIKSIFHLASDVTERMQAEQVLFPLAPVYRRKGVEFGIGINWMRFFPHYYHCITDRTYNHEHNKNDPRWVVFMQRRSVSAW